MRTLLAVMALVSALGCDKGDPLKEFAVLTDRMCECKTPACVAKVNEDHEKWQKKFFDAEMKTMEERQRGGDLADMMIDCEEAIVGPTEF